MLDFSSNDLEQCVQVENTSGYDGHCLRAYNYFSDKMPDIDPNSVESINSISRKHPAERQESKAPTFALTL